MKYRLLQLLLFSLWACAMAACASNGHVAEEYNENLVNRGLHQTSKQTVILFLIDGLPLSTFQEQWAAGNLPQIKKYFIANADKLHVARTTFPALTFPGVGSLLTERTVDQNELYGNKILKEGESLDFESPVNNQKLNDLIRGRNIFARLEKKGLKTVSFDYNFIADSSAHMAPQDAKAGLAILDKKYDYVDSKLIGSLEDLLNQTDPKVWPDFIFIHLIGIDLTSHDQGPKSQTVRKYLTYLDHELRGVFKTLTKIETSKQRKILALMTADHGFDQKISKSLNLEQTLKYINPQIQVLNEGRYLSLYFPPSWLSERKSSFMQDLASLPMIDIVTYREQNNVFINSDSLELKLAYGPRQCQGNALAFSVTQERAPVQMVGSGPLLCPESLDERLNQLYYPYFLSNLSYYFQSPGHPDAVIIPKPGISFKNESKGQHGGPTPQEVFVPLLMRNCTLRDPQHIPALWELLQFM
ncbi:MAG TPA: alkaline phosphatase family protein [Pseudobdellovibrionaceae bacterium]